MVRLVGAEGKGPRNQHQGPEGGTTPGCTPPKLAEALLVKVSSVCHPLLRPPSASGFLSRILVSCGPHQISASQMPGELQELHSEVWARRSELTPKTGPELTPQTDGGRACVLGNSGRDGRKKP
ncbi:unnamed protein product [Rangifer tarandus platyrhynchus]|uniref:Uncharacterized protein n=1 Tax=Rangifer tarandus platyrhynchus TaxID=3082113 RepID=A0AC59YMN3_RANTA